MRCTGKKSQLSLLASICAQLPGLLNARIFLLAHPSLSIEEEAIGLILDIISLSLRSSTLK
jgi:hypothetical protein